jgi:NAD(P)-dependent dehydrogenase (short-subunit alcohol dehydrogenase family)
VGRDFSADQWALILGGSSGFGLATAQKLAAHGMSLCIVHRDRRASLARIEPEFEKIRAAGARLLTFNTDALDAERRKAVLDELAGALGASGRVRLLLHSIAFGNLKLLTGEPSAPARPAGRAASSRAADETGLRHPRLALASRQPTPTSTSSTRRISAARSTRWARACSAGCRSSSRAASSPGTPGSSV